MLLPLLLSASAAAASADLVAAAHASGRPPECTPDLRARASIWALARRPATARYCQLIARALARLEAEPQEALTSAQAAEQVLPGRAAAQVVIGRATLRLGRIPDAVAAFDTARARDPRSLQAPLALLADAIAQRRAGRLQAALDAYRQLGTLASLLPSRADRSRVLLDAALTAMAAAAQGDRRVDEALAYLREAARAPHDGHRVEVALALVLVLDRAGRRDEADALLAEQAGAAAWAGRLRAGWDDLPDPADADMLAGLALELSAPNEAARHYRAYLAGPGGRGPWRRSAAERLDRLVKNGKSREVRRRP